MEEFKENFFSKDIQGNEKKRGDCHYTKPPLIDKTVLITNNTGYRN